MKRSFFIRRFCFRNKMLFILLLVEIVSIGVAYPRICNTMNQPDSAYIFSYATSKNNNRNGLHFAWSLDRKNWHPIGPEYSYLRCDYGRWGAEKRMISPFLILAPDGLWHCVWSVNERDGVLAHATSSDLVHWRRQSYPIVIKDKNCLEPEISYDDQAELFKINWLSVSADKDTLIYFSTTKDFKSFAPTTPSLLTRNFNKRVCAIVSGMPEEGTIHKTSWETIDCLIKKSKLAAYENILKGENTKEDPVRFAALKGVNASITIDATKSKPISDMLIGAFFEDINYAADGGLYAELIQNRDFEYALSDKEGQDPRWNSYYAWSLIGNGASFVVDTINPIHPNNPHYAILDIQKVGAGLVNTGFDGIAIKSGEGYNFSIFARMLSGKKGSLRVRLIGKKGEHYGEALIKSVSSTWKKYKATIIAKEDISDARLEIIPLSVGRIALDMISLFPKKTFHNRQNGLRADLAQAIADIHPRFVRFPGGCVAHGDGIGNIYRWKNTVGALESRKPQRNLWGYHQTVGLGYFEYFQFCEDIGATALPVIAAGVPCQNSATGGAGQQGGIPMCDMDSYVQDILDLIEYANGDKNTKWGKLRAQSGHPKPFNLKYIGIGNEDLITDIFEERFTLIFNTIKEKHPEITVIGTVGPTYEGTDYDEGWAIATKLKVPMVDEHYYQSPGWFIHNQDYYDKYDRSKSKVYLGEYAAHLPGRPNNLETALAEVLYLTAVERNGDVVSMASYAPLLAKEKHTQWNPDLIYFNNTEVKPTVGYYVQQMYGCNAGNEYLSNQVVLSNNNEAVRLRVGVSVVRDEKSSDIIIKLVNMLPVKVSTQLNLEGSASLMQSMAQRTVLTAESPSDKLVTPVSDSCDINNKIQLSPYSFTVIRLNTKKQ